MTLSAMSKTTPTQRLRAAPYAAEVEDALRSGKHPNVRLFAGPKAWERARRHRQKFGLASALLLPPDTSPLSLRWPGLTDLVADVTGLDGGLIRELGTALVRDGLRVAYLLDRDRPERSVRFLRKRRPK